MTSYCYRLPWPPSINTYWRKGGNVTYLTKKAKEFRREVVESLAVNPFGPRFAGRLAIHLELIAPDRRKRDIDNHVKAVLDALAHAGAFEDDEQIDKLIVERKHVEPPGCCDVTITQL